MPSIEINLHVRGVWTPAESAPYEMLGTPLGSICGIRAAIAVSWRGAATINSYVRPLTPTSPRARGQSPALAARAVNHTRFFSVQYCGGPGRRRRTARDREIPGGSVTL